MKALRTNNGWYVHELRGACFVTWVSREDREHALQIPDNKANGLQNYVWDATRVDTEIVDI